MASAEVRYCTASDGIRIVYERAGHGPPLVLLHGFIVDRRTWRPQIDDLSQDFDVIAWDAPGCGESTDPPEETSMAEFADYLAQMMEHAGVPSAHLMGLSWGGTLAIEFTREYSARVLSLTLADTYAGWTGSLGRVAAEERLAGCLRESKLRPEEWVPAWAPGAFSSGASEALVDLLASIMSDVHPVGFRAMSRAVFPDFSDRLGDIDVPTLLIWGDDDKRSPLRAGQELHKRLQGSRLVVIPEAGHVSNMEQPQRFNSAVRTFLAAEVT